MDGGVVESRGKRNRLGLEVGLRFHVEVDLRFHVQVDLRGLRRRGLRVVGREETVSGMTERNRLLLTVATVLTLLASYMGISYLVLATVVAPRSPGCPYRTPANAGFTVETLRLESSGDRVSLAECWECGIPSGHGCWR